MRQFIQVTVLASPLLGLAMLAPTAALAAEPAAEGPKAAGQMQPGQSSAELTGQPGQPVALGLPEVPAASDARFIMVRGLTSGFRLSQGFPVKQSWFLSTTEAKTLQLLPPPDFTGDLVLEILYFKDSKEAPLSSLVRTIVIRPQNSAASGPERTNTAATTATTPAPAPRPIRKLQLTAERETETLARGEDAMKRGDVAAARLLFEDLAAMGSARGAFAMAQSYDADYLRKIFIQGALQPDPDSAKSWYEKAARLGSGDAQRVLSTLEGRAQ
jgi:hypothetical protein